MPHTAILYIAERCNQSCVFCLEEDGAWKPFVDPTTIEVQTEIDRLWDRGARHITFMGGETFFRKDLGRILTHAKQRGFSRVGVTTNGTVLSKKGFLKDLADSGLDFIELSIHGHTEALANAIGGTHFTFERQALALAEIAEIQTPTIVNVVVCRENKDHLLDVAKYVLSFKGIRPRFKLKFVSLQGLAAADDTALRYDEVDVLPVADFLENEGIPFWFYNFPLCVLGRHAKRSHEVATLTVDEQYFDIDHRTSGVGYYDSGHQLEGRVWPESTCAPCALRPLCPGLEQSHRRALATSGGRASFLATRTDEPLDLIRFALVDRGRDPNEAERELARLRSLARPARFVRPRPDGAVRFTHPDEPEPLDLEIEPNAPDRRAFAKIGRFALSYRAWEAAKAASRPNVKRVLDAAIAALRDAEARALTIEAARASVEAIPVASPAGAGWTLDRSAAPKTQNSDWRSANRRLPQLPPL